MRFSLEWVFKLTSKYTSWKINMKSCKGAVQFVRLFTLTPLAGSPRWRCSWVGHKPGEAASWTSAGKTVLTAVKRTVNSCSYNNSPLRHHQRRVALESCQLAGVKLHYIKRSFQVNAFQSRPLRGQVCTPGLHEKGKLLFPVTTNTPLQLFWS